MDIGTLIGIVGGVGLIVGSIMMSSGLSAFVDVPSLVVVFGGTAMTTLIAEKLPNVIGGIKVALKAFFGRTESPEETIKTIGLLAYSARKDGILALESMAVSNSFLAKAVRLAVDGIAPEEIRASLVSELAAMRARHRRGRKLFSFMAETAPSMGMIGTLIGLVQMLQSLDDPSTIGPAMAVALLTTFYGAIIAFVVCAPIAEKLAINSDEETASMTIVVEGIDGILKGENPRILQEKLEGYLAPAKRSEGQSG
ncbi:MAG: MotA/TolQ/ExbB proton channel family protein [Myxococcota bacterium]